MLPAVVTTEHIYLWLESMPPTQVVQDNTGNEGPSECCVVTTYAREQTGEVVFSTERGIYGRDAEHTRDRLAAVESRLANIMYMGFDLAPYKKLQAHEALTIMDQFNNA
jgi:hypothetical protein